MCKFGDPPGSSNFHTGLEDAQPKFQIGFLGVGFLASSALSVCSCCQSWFHKEVVGSSVFEAW